MYMRKFSIYRILRFDCYSPTDEIMIEGWMDEQIDNEKVKPINNEMSCMQF